MNLAHVPSLRVEQALDVCGPRIDLRAPVEFALDHLPEAHNLPLFDDDERALVGTLYRRRSPAAAFEAGRRLAERRIAELVAQIGALGGWQVPRECGPGAFAERVAQMTAGGLERLQCDLVVQPLEVAPANAILLHCWRGGLRSRSVVAFVRALGCERAVALEGGYHAYRAWVNAALAAWQAPAVLVLRGLTGVGKTLVLRELERQLPGRTLDLEGLAGHRSSILGAVGLEPRSQRAFESGLVRRMREAAPGTLVVEGESRKVGDVIVPPRLWEAMQRGRNVELFATLERRIDVLLEEYCSDPRHRADLRAQLPFLEQRLGAKAFDGKLVGRLDGGRERELVAILLERYYDPLYGHSERGREHCARIDASDPARAAREIAALL